MSGLDRQPLRERIREKLTEKLLFGGLEPDAPIRLSPLADTLGVSRTPVREALIALEREGLVKAEQGSGFVAAELDPDTARDLYELIPVLEGKALHWSEPFDQHDLDELERLDIRRRNESKPQVLLSVDRAWHSVLVQGCHNAELIRNLERLRWRIYRYEYAYMSQDRSNRESIREHERIRGLLRENRIDQAADLLTQHWNKGIDFLDEFQSEALSRSGP